MRNGRKKLVTDTKKPEICGEYRIEFTQPPLKGWQELTFTNIGRVIWVELDKAIKFGKSELDNRPAVDEWRVIGIEATITERVVYNSKRRHTHVSCM